MLKRTKQPPVSEEASATVVEEVHKCPFCDYTAKRASILGRHVNFHHKGLRENSVQGMVEALKGKKDVPSMLMAAAEWLQGATNYDGVLPQEAIDWLRKEDAKLQIILRIIAIAKINRALDLDNSLKKVDEIFKTKMEDPKWKEELSPRAVAELMAAIQESQQKELSFLKEISQLGEVDISGVIDKLTTTFGKMKGPTAFTISGIQFPDSPSHREALRKAASAILKEGQGSNGTG